MTPSAHAPYEAKAPREMNTHDQTDDAFYAQDFESEGVVSIWLELEKPEAETEVDALQACCGVGHYNVDNQESDHFDEVVDLDRLLSRISYSSSFSKEAIRQANSMGIESAYWILVQFDFAYDPSRAIRPPTGELIFVGVFAYSVAT